jgi:outer membrane protein OmpA-like peptidoglycan-associated protein
MNFLKKNVAAIVLGILFLAATFSLIVSLDGISDLNKHMEQLADKVTVLEKTVADITQERDLLRGEVTSLNGIIAGMKKPAIEPIPTAPVPPPPTIEIKTPPVPVEKKSDVLAETRIFFRVNSYKVDEAGAAEIRRIAQVIKDNKNKVNVTIKGFADTTGPKEWNITLSKERADQVYYRLVNLAGDPIKKCELGVVGMGEATFDGDLASQRVVKITVTECK